jgi:RHS repeat-associated protein
LWSFPQPKKRTKLETVRLAFEWGDWIGVTRVLNEGTNQYLYGVGRISQVNTSTLVTDIVPLRDYFITDALGSVRQLTNGQGEVTLANAYEPYGVLAQSAGSAQASYGFTGEYTDSYIKLIYLRSRLYDPLTGRFTTKDSWQGDYNRPMSYNSWLYVYGNPINLTDPSGHDPWWCDSQPDPDACRDQYLPRVNARVYYLNAIGSNGIVIQPDPDPVNEQGYTLFRVGQIVGPENVIHIPIFIGNVDVMRIQMLLEMCEVRLWSPVVADAISADLERRPLSPAERLVIIGNSGGGTAAIESLDLLQKKGIFVDQVILRGSPVRESSLKNVGRVDYITAEFYGGIIPDQYYSFDSNPFDDIQVQEHRIDFEQSPPIHTPRATRTKNKIANLIVSLIIDGAR